MAGVAPLVILGFAVAFGIGLLAYNYLGTEDGYSHGNSSRNTCYQTYDRYDEFYRNDADETSRMRSARRRTRRRSKKRKSTVECCTICLEDINPNNEQSLTCKHKFHTACIKQWLQERNVCPNCNAQERNVMPW